MASDPNQDIQRNTVEARQGSTRPGVIYVLIAGVAFVLIAFAVVWAMQGHH